MNIYRPYTYLIGWSKLDYWYYGCQYGKTGKNRANPDNLWVTYFTSSDNVANMREFHGEPDVIEVRRVFRTRDQTLRCEEKVIQKVGAVKSDRWLNRANRGKVFHNRGGWKHNPESREKISIKLKGRKLSDSHKKNIQKNQANQNGPNNHFYGKHHTEESKLKIQLANKGIPRNKGKKYKKRVILECKHSPLRCVPGVYSPIFP